MVFLVGKVHQPIINVGTREVQWAHSQSSSKYWAKTLVILTQCPFGAPHSYHLSYAYAHIRHDKPYTLVLRTCSHYLPTQPDN